ncbi:MAG: hypothetical protein COU46_00330 [Candidatus Niyogibacteria bacterium CG10_big_fil_rev_8_21_14_0_10_42_19]|uniref:Uncharacterized protein n=1 Tax=Candidatus Niyogibacteria bacterium CG10_big_fil_rev_8_21_14_0_10_42_19 TaxID=1974725 RepID=A0A2H0TGH6_9BACT|nr:MAG: hypothetical protein COU46_00330 [Candidatus Niyogibacteria bacterium CG10_big_fil_rev_8_21_14_0_10_42_19]
MESIFVFDKNVNFAEELEREKNFKGKTLEHPGDRRFYVIKEITEKTDKEIIKTTYQVPQSPGDDNFIWAVARELEKQKFKIFIFDGKKREIARMLIKAPLTAEERLGFFNDLVLVADSEVQELRKGIEEDLRLI